MTPRFSRRLLVLGAATSVLLAACATGPATDNTLPPIVFVHGNGDSAALWTTTLWRFESNGWARERLFAYDVPYPLARTDDTVPQEGRSSTTDNMQALAAEVDKALRATGASRVVLMASSRGGYAVRNYIANGFGSAKVSHAILGGTPNHGVRADPTSGLGNEFNGAGPFLMGLNAPRGPAGDEVTPGVKWMTIRSDNNDLYAQPDGRWLGAPGTPTNVSFDGPALKGAQNIVIAGIDHRETAFGSKAFEQAHRFITGKLPASSDVRPEARVVLDGKLSGYGVNNERGTAASNLPLVGATVEVYAINATTGERLGAALHRKTVGADGRWGPLTTDAQARHEFVIAAPGYATTHIYRSPFPRSSNIVGLRAERIADADKGAGSIVTLTRPRGYFGLPRDRISLDGKAPPGVPQGTAGVASSKLKLTEATGRTIEGEFNGERVVGRTWPTANNQLSLLELTY
ncbi:MAG: twin-arginine translocation pathway signal [Burkholderiales bacterium]|nr:twin-arginine translocation pathway signal [Burkholderiales bacterium]